MLSGVADFFDGNFFRMWKTSAAVNSTKFRQALEFRICGLRGKIMGNPLSLVNTDAKYLLNV